MAEHDMPVAIGRLLARWMVGTATPLTDADAPAAWRAASGLDPELRTLAIATQCRQFLMHASAPRDAAIAPAFPPLPLPAMPETSRLRFRRALPSTRQALPAGALVRLVTARGCVPHPFDWQPEDRDEPLPRQYDAWRAWATQERGTGDVLDADSWDALAPAQRRRMFERLRRQSPAAACALLASHAETLPADQRLSLVEALRFRLSIDDAALLSQLSKDRSEKVRTRVAQLRARIGDGGPRDAEATDALRACFVIERKGLLKRRSSVSFAALKTKPQRSARRELLQAAGWDAIASAVGLDAVELGRVFALGEDDDDHVLLQSAADTADDACVGVLMERLLFERASASGAWVLLVDRLDDATREALALRSLSDAGTLQDFSHVLALAQACLPVLPLRGLAACLPLKTLRELATSDAAQAGTPPAALLVECAAAGCLLPADAARHVLNLLIDVGIRPGDPMLDTLHLNLQLAEHAAQGPHA